MGISIISFSIVTFCGYFTGQFFALPVYVVIFHGLSYWIYAIVNYFVSSFAYGVEYGSIMDGELLEWFSPFMMMYKNLDVDARYKEGIFEGMVVSGAACLLVYIIVAIGLLVAAYLVYQRRHIEQAGDLITVSWVRPIFRWGVGTTGAFFGSLILKYIFENIGRGFSIPVYMVVLLICGIISYFVADMFVKKSFKVFYKNNWMKCGIFSAILLVSFGALSAYSAYCKTYIPSEDKIISASVSNYYTCEFDGEV
jgi:ABC-2 type transport system permease protein